MGDRERADRFLTATADLHNVLKKRRKGIAEHTTGLGAAVRELADAGDNQIRTLRPQLARVIELRNAIAHDGYLDGEPIAAPRESFVRATEKLLDLLANPPKAFAFGVVPTVFQQDAPLQTALEAMVASDLSQAPVLAGDHFRGLLTTNAVARWVAAHMDPSGGVLVTDATVFDVLPYVEAFEKARFATPGTSAAQVVGWMTSTEPPAAVLFTASGNEHEPIQRILVAADAPRLQAAVHVSMR